MQKRIETVRGRVRARGATPARVMVVIWSNPLIVAGGGSFIDEMIELAGGANVAGDLAQAYPVVSPELVVERDPQHVILGFRGTPESVTGMPGWSGVDAVKHGRIHADLDIDALLRPGPRFVEGVEAIHRRLYETTRK